jgi:hypothetical protein
MRSRPSILCNSLSPVLEDPAPRVYAPAIFDCARNCAFVLANTIAVLMRCTSYLRVTWNPIGPCSLSSPSVVSTMPVRDAVERQLGLDYAFAAEHPRIQ